MTIAAYMYRAELFCPNCIVSQMHWSPTEDRSSAEDSLDDMAHVAGIDRQDEWSFDSDNFPKVVFSDELADDYCGGCGEKL